MRLASFHTKSTGTAARVKLRWLWRAVAELLLFCLVLQALVSSAQWAVGRAHIHRTPAPGVAQADELDVRLAGHHSHGAPQQLLEAPQSTGDDPSQARPHAHTDFGHHRHDATDATVVAMADPSPAGMASGETLPRRSAQNVWGLLSPRAVPAPTEPRRTWRPPPHLSFCSACVAPLDRPPRA